MARSIDHDATQIRIGGTPGTWLDTWRGTPATPLPDEDRWLHRIRMMVLEQHERPVWREASQIVELLLEANANTIRWPSIVWAISHFPSAFLPQHSGTAGRDLVEELLVAARGTGIQVVPYCHIGVMHRETFVRHPEWAARTRDGVALRWKDLHYLFCVSNPDGMAAYQGAVGEIVRRYDVPALYFDGPVWYGQCACHYCQKAFERIWGYPMPARLTWEDGSQPHYQEMRYRQVVDAMRQVEDAIREAQGSRRIPAMFNTGMTHPSGRRNGSIPERVMAHAAGCLSTEVHRRAGDEVGEHGAYAGIMDTVRLGVSLKRVALCYTPPGPFESLVTHDSLDTELFGATYLALGGTPIVETARSFLFDRTGLPAVRALFERMERHAPLYYDAVPVRHALLLYSRQTAEHFAGEDQAGRYGQHFAGASRALSHDHQPFECLYDWHLCPDALAGARVLVLAGAAALSDAQIDLIRDFVRQGGGLVATGEASLCDEYGRRRRDFGLADLFGASYRGSCPPGDYSALQYREGDGYEPVPEAYLRWVDRAHPLAAGMPADQLVPISDAWWTGGRKEPPDYVLTQLSHPLTAQEKGTIVAELFLPAGGANGQPFNFPRGHPPGVIASTYGAGRVVYLASGVPRHYLRRGLRSLRVLFNNAVDWAAAVPRPFRVHGPATLFAHLTRYHGGDPTGTDTETVETLALHLINYTGDMHEAAAHRVEYVAPIHNLPVEIAIPAGRTVRSVSRLLTGDTLRFAVQLVAQPDSTDDGGWSQLRLDLPKLGTTETLLIRLGSP
jgi:hypothetical protein